jgi:Tol biopolymer transport system component
MGVVYLAQDVSLGRSVALKLLPTHLTGDPDRLRRFEREARSVSALNHPNILTIHEIGQVESLHFIATEFIDGVTLRERIASKELKLGEALNIAEQIGAALAAAHEAGIVHRDIKPENVMLRRDGYVKVLDFGLAKLTEQQTVRANEAHASAGVFETRSGMIIGTARYMSPEQARGLALDARSDIWSLGVVLYEMIAGCAPFAGETDSDVMVSILEREPLSLTRNLPKVPTELQRIVSKALCKDREERYQVVKDMLLDLRSLSRTGQDIVADPRVLTGTAMDGERAVRDTDGVGHLEEPPKRRSRLIRFAPFVRWLTAIAVLGLIVAGAVILLRRSPPPRIGSTVQLTNDGRGKTDETIVTDGSRVYFSEDIGQTFGFAQVATTGGEATMIPAHFLEVPHQGFLFDISRDRNELLVGKDEHDAKEPTLWTMSVLGGPGRRVGDLRGHSACWSPDAQRIAYANGQDLYIAKSDGTESRKLVTPPVSGIPIFPSWSPDGTRLRFNVVDFVKETSTLWEEAVDGTGLHPLFPDWKGKESNHGWGGRWTPDGRYYVFLVGNDIGFGRGANIWALRETESFFGKTDRTPIQLTFGPLSFFPPVFSPDGKKLFTIGYLPHGEVMRYDVLTKHWGPVLSGTSAINLDFSRDGQWVTYVNHPYGPLWRSRADGSQRLQLTSPEIKVMLPRWSPDGKQIVFNGQVPGQPFQIYVVSAKGGKAEQLVQTSCNDVDPTWSPDGSRLVFGHLPPFEAPCKAEIYVLDLKSHQVSTIAGSDGLFSPRWSPDGNAMVAVTSDFSRLMLFSFTNQKWEELAKGGFYPGWSRDGRFVYFMNDNDVLRVRIADRRVEKVVSLKDVRLKIGFTGLSLTPDDSPLLLFETSVREVYALDWIAP